MKFPPDDDPSSSSSSSSSSDSDDDERKKKKKKKKKKKASKKKASKKRYEDSDTEDEPLFSKPIIDNNAKPKALHHNSNPRTVKIWKSDFESISSHPPSETSELNSSSDISAHA